MKTHKERAEEAARAIIAYVQECPGEPDDEELLGYVTGCIACATQPSELVAAAREFVRKVGCGEARSERSYSAFKEALALYEPEEG